MMEYHAAYYEGDDGWVVAMVLDFPGANSQGKTLRSARRMIRDALRANSQGKTLRSARRMIRDALRLMAETHIEMGEPLPAPNPKVKDKKAIFMEKIPVSIRVPIRVPS